jgi:hypothetical protein
VEATGRGVPANVQPEAALRAAPGGSAQPCVGRGSGKRRRGRAPEEGGDDESSGATGTMHKRPALVRSVGEVVVQPRRGGSRKAAAAERVAAKAVAREVKRAAKAAIKAAKAAQVASAQAAAASARAAARQAAKTAKDAARQRDAAIRRLSSACAKRAVKAVLAGPGLVAKVARNAVAHAIREAKKRHTAYLKGQQQQIKKLLAGVAKGACDAVVLAARRHVRSSTGVTGSVEAVLNMLRCCTAACPLPHTHSCHTHAQPSHVLQHCTPPMRWQGRCRCVRAGGSGHGGGTQAYLQATPGLPH